MWIFESFDLLIETRTCESCKSVFEAPNSSPRVRCRNQRNETVTISIQEYEEILTGEHRTPLTKRLFSLDQMPRTLSKVDRAIPYCQHCFYRNNEVEQTEQILSKQFRAYNTEISFALMNEEKRRIADIERRNLERQRAREELFSGAGKRKPGSGKHKQKRAMRAPREITMEDFE